MSDEIPIGPNRCHHCGGEYGQHAPGCSVNRAIQQQQKRKAAMNLNQTSQDFLRNLERLIEITTATGQDLAPSNMHEELQLIRRDLIDYLISTDPRAGVYTNG